MKKKIKCILKKTERKNWFFKKKKYSPKLNNIE